ncbi:terpenoid synthase [Sparassis latifolia]
MFSLPKQFILPDLISPCPFKGGAFSPHYTRASAASRAWVGSYTLVAEEKRHVYLNSGSAVLAAHAYHYAAYEQFRTICDFISVLFTLDEISDEQNGADARTTMNVFLEVLTDPNWDDGTQLAKFCRDFRARFSSTCGPACYGRFLKLCKGYIDAVIVEAELREREEVLDLQSYLPLRRANSAVPFCFGLFDYALGIDLPDEAYEHPIFKRMLTAAIDMVCWSNDLYSYNMEQAMGHTGNNILTVLMKQENIDLQAAADYVGEHFGILVEEFVADKARLPSFGPHIDAMVAKHIMGMETWAIGNLEWSFEVPRYFGPDYEEVKRTRVVTLYPKKN